MLNTGMDAALSGLAEMAGSGWMMNLPQQQEAHCGHAAGKPAGYPADHAQPGIPGHGGGPEVVAVTFGQPAGFAESGTVLPVQWESVTAGDGFTVLLDGDITLSPATGRTQGALTLAGFCRLPESTCSADGYDMARAQVVEAAREFITSVAVTATGRAEPGQEPPGPAWSWLNGLPRV